MSLKDRREELAKYIEANQSNLDANEDLFDVYEGDFLKFVKRALKAELSEQSYYEVEPRIAPINILRRIVDKLSRIYQQEPVRSMAESNDSDSELLRYYQDAFSMNNKMNISNEFFNLFKNTLIHPYLNNDGEPKLRIIPSSQFLPFSDDKTDRTNPTGYIVFAGVVIDEDTGNPKKIYYVFTDDEFIIIDERGDVQQDKMNELGNPEGVNPIGVLPFVYVNKSQNLLIPKQDTDTLPMSVLIAVLISDLNLTSKYTAFPISYGIDVKQEGLIRSPNAFWTFTSDPTSDKKPEIGTVKPEADIDKTINLIQSELSLWLNSRGIRPGSVGSLKAENVQSGISKIIDEMDTFEDRQRQVEFFIDAEKRFWDLLINHIHPFWVQEGLIENRALFSTGARVITNFSEQLPLVNRSEVVDTLIKEVAAGFTTREIAVKRLNPRLTDQEVESLMADIDEERQATVEVMEDSSDDENMDDNTEE